MPSSSDSKLCQRRLRVRVPEVGVSDFVLKFQYKLRTWRPAPTLGVEPGGPCGRTSRDFRRAWLPVRVPVSGVKPLVLKSGSVPPPLAPRVFRRLLGFASQPSLKAGCARKGFYGHPPHPQKTKIQKLFQKFAIQQNEKNDKFLKKL